MTATAQYATTVRSGGVQINTANANRDGTGSMGQVLLSGAIGSRIDGLAIQALATTTAGMLRFFEQKGRPGPALTSITFSGTTATATTASAHGLTSGDLISSVGYFPDQYNVTNAAVTVSSPTTFTFAMAVAPTVAATVVPGFYSTSLAVPVRNMLLEINVNAVTPSATQTAFSAILTSGYLPLALQPGYSLWVSTNNAELFAVTPTLAGDF